MGRRTLACCVALLSACGRVDFELARLTAAPDAGLPTGDTATSLPGADSNNGSDTATRVPNSSDSSEVTGSDVDSTSPQSSDTEASSATDATNDDTLSNTSAPTLGSSEGTSEMTLSTDAVSTSDVSSGTTSSDVGSSPETSTDPPIDTATTGTDDSGTESTTTSGADSTSSETMTTDATSGPEPACTAGTSQYPTVQSVLDDAACPTVYVPAQTFVEDVNVARDVRVEGVSSATSILEGTGAGSVAMIGAGRDVEFTSITVRGGAGSQGGGIASLANLTLSDVIITDNHVTGVDARGGGVYQQGGSLDLLNVSFSGNGASLSGGAGNARGGGLFASGVSVGLDGVVFDGNLLQCGGEGVDCYLEGAGAYVEANTTFTSTGNGVAFTGNDIDMVESAPLVILSAYGAGLSCLSSTVQLQSGADTITGNTLTIDSGSTQCDANGGGLFANACGVQLSSVDVTGNNVTASSGERYAVGMGGGVAVVSTVLAWTGVTCDGNVVRSEVPTGSTWPSIARGGCASVDGSTASITYSTFSNNRAEAIGSEGVVLADAGALLIQASTTNAIATVLGCSFGPNNQATSTADDGTSQRSCGGAVSVWSFEAGDQEVLMTSTTISGNRVDANAANAVAEGGGIDVGGDTYGISHVEMSNVTIAGNDATGAVGGGGLHLRSDGGAQASATLRNSILADSTGTGNDCEGGSVELEGNNLIETTSCAFTGSGSAVALDPELGAIADNGGSVLTCSLSSTSPARNAGPVTGCLDELGYEVAVDARGMSRVDDCDLGAFEAQSGE